MRILALLAGMAFVLTAGPLYAEGGKIGVVDVRRVLNEYKKTDDYGSQLEKRNEELKKEHSKKTEELRGLWNQLEILTEEGREEKQEEIDQKMQDLRKFQVESRRLLAREHSRMRNEIFKEIDGTVSDYGKKNNFSLIVVRDAAIYFDTQGIVDITEAVLQELNSRYKK